MNKNIYLSLLLLLMSLFCVSTDVQAATEITIPTTSGSFVNWNNATYSGCNIENGGANIGSTGSKTEVSFTIKNETQQSYVVSFNSGAKETATWSITLSDGSKTWLDASADIPNIGDYTLKTPFAYIVSNLPAGTYTLKFKVNSSEWKYAGNIGNLSITALKENNIIGADGSYLGSDAYIMSGRSNCGYSNNNFGNTDGNTLFVIGVKNSTAQDYVLSFLTGASGLTAELGVTLSDGVTKYLDATASVEKTGSWTPSTEHTYLIKNLPAGSYGLVLKVKSTTGSYAGNYGNIMFKALSDYDKIPSALTLTNGTYNGPRVEPAGNVGYVQNDGTATYLFYNPTAQYYQLNTELYRYGQGGNVNISIQDATTGTSEYNEDYEISPDASASYTATDLATVKLTEGLKVMTLSFSKGNGYICNYQNLKFNEVIETATIKSGFQRTSFASSYPIDFSRTKGVKAYIVTSTGDNNTVVEEVTSVPANTGVILESQGGAVSEDTSFKLYTAATASLEDGKTNLLQAAVSDYTVQSGETVYGYGKKNQKEGFYLYAPGRTVSAGKAYLKLTTSSAKPFFSFGAGSTTTGIEHTAFSHNNGDREEAVYNFAGQRVGNGYKGIVIKNGKKYIEK